MSRRGMCGRAGRVVAAAAAVVVLAASGAHAGEPGAIVFRVGKIVTVDEEHRVINNGVVVVEGGKITAVGRARDVAAPEGAAVVERPELWLVPGMIDCHNHVAGGLGDLNDMVYLTNPGLRTLETIAPNTYEVERAQAGGVTGALLIPGSGTNISGFGTITKMGGDSVAEMVIRSPGSIKVAQAGNPEGYWYGVGRTFMNYNTRQTLHKALAYHRAWEDFEQGRSAEKPAFDPAFHEFRGLFTRQYVASVHTQIYQVVMTTIDMLGEKLGVRVLIDHGEWEGWKTTPLSLALGSENIRAMLGPREYDVDFTQRKITGIAASYWNMGFRRIGSNTDAPVVPVEELFYQATMSCWYGWKPYEALAGVTRYAAEGLLAEDRIGSIAPGKDADFCLWTGDPIDPRSSVEMTVISGEIVYDASKGRRF